MSGDGRELRTTTPWLRLSAAAALVLIGLISAAVATAAPQIEHWTTKNGARVYFVAAADLPMVDISVVFDAGSARDGDKGGLALLTAGLLDDGAGELTTDVIAERFEAVGAVFGSSADRDMLSVSLRTLSDESLLSVALDTLRLILAKPTFPQEAFERERDQMLTGLRAERQSPGAIAARAFYSAIYGSHPYGQMVSGTEESVAALTRSDVVEHHARYFTGRNAVIAIVGAVDRRKARTIADDLASGLPPGEPAPALPAVAPLAEAMRVHIDHPSTQSHVFIGAPGISRSDPDYFPLYVGNFILGGSGLVSMLSEEVREKRGLSYSVYSYFEPLRKRGPFTIGLQTRNDQVGEAISVVQETLRGYLKNGPSKEALEEAKQNITGGFPLRVDSNSKIVNYLSYIGFYQLPLDYLDTFNAHIEQVTADQIRTAFERGVRPDRLVTVTVGAAGAQQ